MTKIERHTEICKRLTELYASKNSDYGDSFSKARTEVPYYTLGKLYDKFMRYKNLTLCNGNPKVKTESVTDTLSDLANYCIMELVEREISQEK